MAQYPRPLGRLIGELSKLPGIGGKTAQRLAFHILLWYDVHRGAYALSMVISKVKMRKFNFIVNFFIFIFSFSYLLGKALNFNIQGFLLFQI